MSGGVLVAIAWGFRGRVARQLIPSALVESQFRGSRAEPDPSFTTPSVLCLSHSRRRFLRSAAGVALGVPLLAACAPQPLTPSATRPAAVATTSGATGNSVFPTYLAATSGPKPDFPASGPMYDDGFNGYPANPVKALPADPPGTGGPVSIMSIQLFPPPTVYDQNAAWQAVNKALNATVKYQIVTAADYPVKLGTVMAGNDLPDMLYMYSRPGASSTLAAAAGVPQFLQSQAADLTPYLGGDAAKDYPNLAAIPTQAWKNAGCAYQGHLYMIPIHRYLPSYMWLKNASVYDKTFGADYVPKNADDFKRVLQAMTRPNAGLLRHLRRAGQHHVAAAVQPALRRAQRLAAGIRRQADQGLGDARVQGDARLRCATCTPRASFIRTRPRSPAASSPAGSSPAASSACG